MSTIQQQQQNNHNKYDLFLYFKFEKKTYLFIIIQSYIMIKLQCVLYFKCKTRY